MKSTQLEKQPNQDQLQILQRENTYLRIIIQSLEYMVLKLRGPIGRADASRGFQDERDQKNHVMGRKTTVGPPTTSTVAFASNRLLSASILSKRRERTLLSQEG
jgi:hypothetical protein